MGHPREIPPAPVSTGKKKGFNGQKEGLQRAKGKVSMGKRKGFNGQKERLQRAKGMLSAGKSITFKQRRSHFKGTVKNNDIAENYPQLNIVATAIRL